MSLPTYTPHNVCLEVAAIAAATARELGFHQVVERIGWWEISGAERIPHAWVEIDGLIVHSRRRAGTTGCEVELVHVPHQPIPLMPRGRR